MPTFSSGPFTGSPPTETFPEVAGSSPEMILSSVLLPQPLGPTMDTKLPESMSKETFSSAVTVLAPPLKDSGNLVDGNQRRHENSPDARNDQRLMN